MSIKNLEYFDDEVTRFTAFARTFDPRWQTVYNGASVISKRFNVPGESVFYLGFRIPAGRLVVLYSRELILDSGSFNIDVQAVTSFDETAATEMIVTPLNTDNPTAIQTQAWAGVGSVVGGVTLEEWLSDVPSTVGAQKVSSAAQLEGVYKIYGSASTEVNAAIRIEKLDVNTARGAVRLIAWEDDA